MRATTVIKALSQNRAKSIWETSQWEAFFLLFLLLGANSQEIHQTLCTNVRSKNRRENGFQILSLPGRKFTSNITFYEILTCWTLILLSSTNIQTLLLSDPECTSQQIHMTHILYTEKSTAKRFQQCLQSILRSFTIWWLSPARAKVVPIPAGKSMLVKAHSPPVIIQDCLLVHLNQCCLLWPKPFDLYKNPQVPPPLNKVTQL